MRYTDYYLSPAGVLEITASESHILSVRFVNQVNQACIKSNRLTQVAIDYLSSYFEHKPVCPDIDLFLLEGTEFQKKVWLRLLNIPYGKTISYKELALQTGAPKAVRAVGTAVGKNPFCILLPCHRVLPATGKTGQYAYGSHIKSFLLDFESKSNL